MTSIISHPQASLVLQRFTLHPFHQHHAIHPSSSRRLSSLLTSSLTSSISCIHPTTPSPYFHVSQYAKLGSFPHKCAYINPFVSRTNIHSTAYGTNSPPSRTSPVWFVKSVLVIRPGTNLGPTNLVRSADHGKTRSGLSTPLPVWCR